MASCRKATCPIIRTLHTKTKTGCHAKNGTEKGFPIEWEFPISIRKVESKAQPSIELPAITVVTVNGLGLRFSPGGSDFRRGRITLASINEIPLLTPPPQRTELRHTC